MSYLRVSKRIYERFEISAAHKLELPYESKCKRLHGHNYLIEVWIEGEVGNDGMIVDFSDVKKLVKEKYDHVLLNDKLEQPTAENLAMAIFYDVLSLVQTKKRKVKNIKVRVWEDKDSYAEVDVDVQL